MKLSRAVSLVFWLIILSTPLLAVDLKADPSFNPAFTDDDKVHDVVVLEDGKLLIGGAICPANTGLVNCTPMLRRLGADGTIDPTFNVPLGRVSGDFSVVNGVKRLANGQYLVVGTFTLAGERINYVRLNPDGSIDTTMATAWLGFIYGHTRIEPTPDGKFVACAARTINGEVYKIAHRINSDGTPDPTFRITMDGFCRDIETLPTGKVLIAVGTDFGQTQVKELQRLNPDGSKDLTFEADIPVDSYSQQVAGLTALADGRVLLSYNHSSPTVRRLLPNGSTETTFPLCGGDVFLLRANLELITNQCKRWSGTFHRLHLARVLPDGSVDPAFDDVYFNGRLYGIRETADDTYYAYGTFRSVNFDTSRRHLVRLIPNTTPPKAKFDFDGDGRSDLAVFRPSDQVWYLNRSTEGYSYHIFGFSTDALAAGHFDNDGRADIGMFRDGTLHAYSPAFAHRQIFMGLSGDKPLLGNFEDYYGNLGDFTVRGIRSGTVQWFFRDGNAAGNPFGTSLSFSLPGELLTDKPVVGDFNGDSRDDVGYFRDGMWFTADFTNFQPPRTFYWGTAGDIPVPADYDGDRQTDHAIFRPSTGEWWINRTTAGSIVITFGQSGDIPVPADYDGDGKVDVAIYRNGAWWQFRMGSGTIYVDQWGTAGDKPIPAQNQ